LTHAITILGIETSCDETAAAVVRRDPDGSGHILSNLVLSQVREHAPYGGVVPEVAARAHLAHLDRLIKMALLEARMAAGYVDGIAATAGPGLAGGLIVGMTIAKAMAFALGKPFLAINHLEGHALTPRLLGPCAFPYLMLLVSGGHSQFQLVRGVGDFVRLGTTIDDAMGEAFDKTAKLLGLGYPGGPQVEALAARGDGLRFDFPRPLKGRPGCDFSFSGLKTAVREAAQALPMIGEQDRADICASFQAAVVATVEDRLARACGLFREKTGVSGRFRLVVAGGVAANTALRNAMAAAAEVQGADVIIPSLHLCTDNGAMIAWAGAERLALGEQDGFDAAVKPRWPLDRISSPAYGSGRLGAKA
jgi:N6-L-threonylcarbamoyladenine synthase